MIYLFTGEGGGKTTNALGLALRSLGHNKKVVIYQFLKWWKNTGEMLFKHPNYKIFQFGREGWHGFKNLTEADRRLTENGLMYAFLEMVNHKPFLIVLDEINLVAHLGLIPMEAIIEFLEHIPEGVNVVLTGRYAPKTLIDRADFVNEIVDIKHPEEFESVAGIQY